MRAKKALVQKSAFSKPSTNVIKPLQLYLESAYTKITQVVVTQILITQVATKATRLDKVKFQILQFFFSFFSSHFMLICNP